MVNNINSLNSYQVSNSGLNQEELQNTLAKSKQIAVDNYEGSYAARTVSGNTSDPDVMSKTLLLLPPLVVANRFADKMISGAEGKSLFGRIASVGDKISHTLKLDKLFSKETESRVSNFLKNNTFFKYFTNDYKAVAKNAMARSQTLTEKYASSAVEALSQLKDVPECAKYLDEAAGFFKPETLKHFGLSEGSIASKAPLTKEIADDLAKGLDKILADGMDDVVRQGTLLKDPVRLSELRNKVNAASSNIGKTGIGQKMAKGALKTKDLLTFGGGLISLAFTANALVQAIKATKEAPKGEKKSTFMHVLSEQYIGMLLFQPSINLLYKAGGNKYRGMTTAGREALKDLITKTNADETLTKEAIKVANLQKKLLLQGVDKDKVAQLAGKGLDEAKTIAKSLKGQGAKLKFWEKPLKAVGTVLDAGLDTIKKQKYIKLGKFKIKAPTLKGFAGGFMRFALIMFVIQPFLQKPVTKLVHKIFGKPNAYLAKQQASNNPEQNAQANPVETTQQVQTTTATVQPNNAETNLVKRWTQPAVQPQQTVTATQSTPIATATAQALTPLQTSGLNNTQDAQNSQIAALNIFDKKNKEGSRYIPSISPVQIQDNEKEIEAQVKAILKETDGIMSKSKGFLN